MRRKGKSMVGQLFLFSIGILLFTVMMVVMNSSGSESNFERTVNGEINYEISKIKQNAVMTSTLEDHVFRAEQIQPSRYGNLKAKKLISLYYSTEGDTLYHNGKSFPMTPSAAEGEERSVSEDLSMYLEHKMEQHWADVTEPVDYRMTLRSGDSSQDPIVVGNMDSARAFRTEYQLPMTGGGTVDVIMELEGCTGALGVTGG